MEQFLLISEGELTLKGHNRRFFERVLIDNITEHLKKYNLYVKREKRGRLYIKLDNSINANILVESLSKIPGLKAIYQGYKIIRDFEVALKVILNLLTNAKNFKIQASRVDKDFEPNSLEMNKLLGQKVLDNMSSIKVDIKNPEIIVFVEVFSDHFKIYAKKTNALGGLPYGSSGKAISLLSTGIDSPVATFLMLKRGLEIIPLYFHTPPYTGNIALEKVRLLAKNLLKFTARQIKLYIVNYTEVQLSIKKNIPEKYWTIVSRRFMGRISEDIAALENANAIITGESLGQVASQTIFNLAAIDEVFTLPVFRPLIGMDKEEIVKIAQHIGTFDISISEGIDCCTLFSSKRPETKAKLYEFVDSEKEILVNLKNMYSYNVEIAT
jgi:thiamine biosynthesis protein ThiI